MKVESYNRELVYSSALFMDTWNDIRITRNSGKTIKVKCLNGKRSRIFKSLENPHKTMIQPPFIICTRHGLSRDPTRVADLNKHVIKMVGIDYNAYPPNPVNLPFTLTIVTKYQEDMDKILTNFIPFANQSFFVKSPHPKDDTEIIKHEVVWNGEIVEEDITELDITQQELYVATTEFTFKTWIWPGTKVPSPSGIIEKINFQPDLCSLGTQRLLIKNGVTDAESLCALSGFMLDDSEYYNDIYSLSHWYAVPTQTSFEDFEDKIKLGYIDPIFYDSLPLSANISGYVHDLGLGLSVGDAFTLSGNEMYYVDNEGAIVIYAATSALTEPFSATCMPDGISAT